MLVTLFQYDVAWLDPDSNLSKIEHLCSKLSGQSDLLVLPEMFNTGYIMQPHELDLKWQEETIQNLMNISSKYGMTIAGSIPMFKSGHYYNTFIAVNTFGIIAEYDKMHLFSLAGEAKHYASGKQVITFDLNGFKIQPLICYDLRFPYISYIDFPVDVIIYTANWPKNRISHWKSLLIGRAIENQCYVVGVNRTGRDNNDYEYPGVSMVVDYNGEILVELEEDVLYKTINLDLAKLKAYRDKLPFLKDRNWAFKNG